MHITMVFGNPYALKNFCDADNLIECYEDDPIFQQAAFNWLNGEFVLQQENCPLLFAMHFIMVMALQIMVYKNWRSKSG